MTDETSGVSGFFVGFAFGNVSVVQTPLSRFPSCGTDYGDYL